MRLEKFKKKLENIPTETFVDTKRNMDILDRMHELLNERFKGKQSELAKKMGKTEAEISRLLSGVQNYTLNTITKFELAFDAKILGVITDISDDNSTWMEVKLCVGMEAKSLTVSVEGQLEQTISDYKEVTIDG
jgi:putative heme iron utilization protein